MSKFGWILLLISVLIVFSPTLSTYFSQDDWAFLSHVYKQSFLSVFKHYPEAFYRPVGQQLFFFLGSRLFGLEPQGFHLIGLAIHLFNIWLLGKILNIWDYDRRVKYFLLTFYAVNPAHFVALNWLTQVDIEIAVMFSLLTILFWKRTIFSIGFFLAALLSHETAVMLPIAMLVWIFKGQSLRRPACRPGRQGLSLLKPTMFFCVGILVLIIKYLINPFSLQSDYSLSFNLFGFLATLKWYTLRAFMIPEGIRDLPTGLIIFSLIPGLILVLMFRQKLVRGLGIYLLGVLPVLGFSGHLLSGYAVFGIALMVIELGRGKVVNLSSPRACREIQRSDLDRPDSVGARFLGFARNDTIYLLMLALILPSLIFSYFNVSKHWSTTRGIISARLTQDYIEADSDRKREILTASADFANNAETYFSSMAGKQFEVLDRGVGRGVFDFLLYRGNDLTTQFLPDAEFFKTSILAGKFPGWNPWIMAGMPYFLDPQNFMWYPPNYIFLLVPVETGFLLLLIGHLVLAGWGMKKILWRLGSLGYLGAGMFVLSPKLAGHIDEGNWTLVIAACWLPILYWSMRKNKFWETVISLSAIIINNLNIGYYAMIFSAVYFLLKSPPDRLLISVKVLVKIWLLVVFLTVPRWLPLVLFGGETVRVNLQEQPLPVWSWTKITKSLVFPLAAGHPSLQNEEILYLGILPLTFGIIFVLRKGLSLPRQGQSLKDTSELGFWFVWLIFVLFVALNNKTPLFHLINKLPGFSLLRITTRPWIFMSLAMALAASIAIRQIWEIRQIRGIKVERKIAKIAVAVLSGLILMEFIWFDWKIFARREIVSDPVPARFYRQMAAGGTLVRAYCTTGCLDRLAAQRMGIALLGGNNPIQLKSYVEYLQVAGGYKETGYYPILPPYTVFNQQPQPKAELLAETATKFVVSPYELTDENFKLVDQQGDFRLYQNTAESQDTKDHYFELETIKML